MKRLLLLILSILLLIGCSNNDNDGKTASISNDVEVNTKNENTIIKEEILEDEVGLSAPIFKMNDFYREGVILSIRDIIAYSNTLVLFVDNELYEEDEIELKSGIHKLEAHVVDKDMNTSETISFEIKVVKYSDYTYSDIYTDMYFDESNMITIPESEVSKGKTIEFYLDLEARFELMKKVVTSKGLICYTEAHWHEVDDPSVIKYMLIRENNHDLMKEIYGYQVQEKLNERGYYTISIPDGIERPTRTYIVHLKTGKTLVLYSSIDQMSFNENMTKVFNYSRYWKWDERKISREVFSLKDDGISKLFDSEAFGYGINNAEWETNDKVKYTYYSANYDEWGDYGYRDLEVFETISFEGDEITLTSDEENVKANHNLYSHLNDEEIVIYESISSNPLPIQTLKYKDLLTTHFTRKFGIIDSKLVLWFEVTTTDGFKAYSYREKWDFEELYVYDGHIVLDDNSLLEIEDYDEFYGGLNMYDYMAPFGYYLLEYYNVESYFYLIPKSGGKHLGSWVRPIPSPDLKFLCAGSTEYVYYDQFIIYAYSPDEINELYSFKCPDWTPSNYKWVSDYELSFIITNKDTQDTHEYHIEFKDGIWKSEEQFEGFEEVVNEYKVVVNVEILNKRSSPNIDAQIVGKTMIGDIYMVLSVEIDDNGDYWYQIDNDVWIASRYCSFSVGD